MREIKFRGKRIWTDEWIYGNLVIDKHGRNHIVPFAYFDEDGHHLSYDDDTDTPVFIMQESVGQFTGLHDKNGKEIYEGDRVKVVIIWNELNRDIKREFISSIVFCEHRGCYIFPNHSNVSLDDARQDDEIISLEVIGNIHENPELLEERE